MLRPHPRSPCAWRAANSCTSCRLPERARLAIVLQERAYKGTKSAPGTNPHCARVATAAIFSLAGQMLYSCYNLSLNLQQPPLRRRVNETGSAAVIHNNKGRQKHQRTSSKHVWPPKHTYTHQRVQKTGRWGSSPTPGGQVHSNLDEHASCTHTQA